jgi:hypothetical protein
MPEIRAKQIAVAAAYLDTDGERVIQAAITALLLSLAQRDKVFAAMLARCSGVSWETLEFAAKQDTLASLIAVQHQ